MEVVGKSVEISNEFDGTGDKRKFTKGFHKAGAKVRERELTTTTGT